MHFLRTFSVRDSLSLRTQRLPHFDWHREIQHSLCTVMLHSRDVVSFGGVFWVQKDAKVVLLSVVTDLSSPFLVPLVPRHAAVRG